MLRSWKSKMENRAKQIFYELRSHAPFTALATAVAVLSMVFIFYFLQKTTSKETFHLFHFLHVAASAMVTAGIFYKYRPRLSLAILVGILGAIVVGSLSDIVFPYLGWMLLNLEIHLHLPLFEETFLVFLFALIGSLTGVLIKNTKPSHLIHVFLSVFASLFYLLTFASVFVFSYFVAAFFIVFVAVIIPCCLSDIVFPFLFIRSKINYEHKKNETTF